MHAYGCISLHMGALAFKGDMKLRILISFKASFKTSFKSSHITCMKLGASYIYRVVYQDVSAGPSKEIT